MEEKKIVKASGGRKKEKKTNEVPIDAQEKLSDIMTDKPKEIRVGKKTYLINALRMGTQWLIAEEAVNIVKAESANMGDVLKQFAINIPSVVKCLVLAILNDKNAIFDDMRTRQYTKKFHALYDDIMWESNRNEWMNTLLEVMNMIDVEVFFYTTDAIQIVREMTLKKKMTKAEVK